MPTVAEPFGSLRDRAVYLPEPDTLVAADLHLGRAAATAIQAPLAAEASVVERLLELIVELEPTTVVLAGDVLDAAGTIPREAERTLRRLRQGVAAVGAAFVAIEGNHDDRLGSLLDSPPTSAVALDDGTVVCHGHEPPTIDGDRYVVGHDHPVIVIEGHRRPCALYGPEVYAGADVLGLPAFTPVVRGTTVNDWREGDPLSPLLEDVTRLVPVIWDAAASEPLVFPRLGSLQPFL